MMAGHPPDRTVTCSAVSQGDDDADDDPSLANKSTTTRVEQAMHFFLW